MIPKDIYITVIGVLVTNEIRMIPALQEFDIVLHEIALVNKVLFCNLLKDIFLGCQFNMLPGEYPYSKQQP